MSIQKVGQNSRVLQPTPDVMKPGQILKGSIAKLYPNNKAEIQLGPQKMIAQLEASLSAGGKYHFMVQATDPVIRLKVIGEQLHQQEQLNISQLLQQLGLKTSKRNIAFLQQLVMKNVPFERTQLVQSFQLLDGRKDKQVVSNLLVDMIANRLPITKNVLQALQTVSNSTLSEKLSNVLPELNRQDIQSHIRQSMQALLGENSTISSAKNLLMGEATHQQNLFYMLKLSGAIAPETEYSTWKASIANHEQENPFQLSERQLRNLQLVNENRQVIQQNAQLIIERFGQSLSQAVKSNHNIGMNLFSELSEQVNKTILPYLPEESNFTLSSLVKNNQQNLSQLYQFMLNATASIPEDLQSSVKLLRDVNFLMSNFPKEHFLQHLKHTISSTGIAYEHNVANDIAEHQSTIKGALLQLIQQADSNTSEQSRQLIHFINGLQLQSVQDTGNLMYASLQIPGEKIGLLTDMQLEFEGRKTNTGEIDASHCRVLFYLDLANLKQTIIDMTVQNRNVSVTVYNQKEQALKTIAKDYQSVLKTGLAQLDYQLSSVMFKPVRQEEQVVAKQQSVYSSPYQGVDYKI
ncbi:hypothetical protein [Oceanobacillus kapialis]|uniref:Flagellar hook-length control protein FliK n=1 Tax=Oceanobacillus kapialis TaxID=481353 RepID=A0ABW5PYB0_9BACI